MIHCVENSKTAQRVLPIHVIYSYWFYSNGRYYRKIGENLAAYENFILALNGHTFDPSIHHKIKMEIEQLIKVYMIKSIDIANTFNYLKDSQSNGLQKEFIFMCDISNPRMSRNDFGKWKNKSRKMAEHIF